MYLLFFMVLMSLDLDIELIDNGFKKNKFSKRV